MTVTPPTPTPGTDLPAEVGVGFVVGRFLRWVLDSSDDEPFLGKWASGAVVATDAAGSPVHGLMDASYTWGRRTSEMSVWKVACTTMNGLPAGTFFISTTAPPVAAWPTTLPGTAA